jgi:autotransporter-associated beta strand protein
VTLGAAGGTLNAAAGAVLNLRGPIGGAGALTKTGGGTVTLSGADTYTGATSVNAGILVLTRSFATNASVNVTGGATLQLAHSSATPNNLVLKTPSLSISGGAQIDLVDNKLIVADGNVGGVAALIASGAITSSLASGGGGGLTTLGLATAGQTAKNAFGGVSVSASDVLVMYTYRGDANWTGRSTSTTTAGSTSTRACPASEAGSTATSTTTARSTSTITASSISTSPSRGALRDTSSTSPLLAGMSAIPEPTGGSSRLRGSCCCVLAVAVTAVVTADLDRSSP